MSPEEVFHPIDRPKHYAGENGLEAVDVMEAFTPSNLHRAMALKYILRAGRKGPAAEDLHKAVWWIKRELAQCQG